MARIRTSSHARQEQAAELGRRVDHVLAVVQDQHQLLAGQHLGQRFGRGYPPLLPYPHGCRYHRGHLRRIGHRRQLDQPHPVRKPGRHPPGHLGGQAGLARPARPGHRHQPVPLKQAGNLAHRAIPADEARQPSREAMHAASRKPAPRRESGIQPGRGELEQPHRPVQALQPVLARVDQREAQLLFLILHQGLRRLRDQHLPAAGRRADPRRPVHRQTRIPAPGRDRLTGVDADPDPDRRAGRPLVARQRPLDLHRAQHGLLRPGERDKKSIPLRVHLMTAMHGDRRPNQPPMLSQHLRIAFPQRLDQPRRPLDVREQEGDRPARQRAHPAPPTPITGGQQHPAAAARLPTAAVTRPHADHTNRPLERTLRPRPVLPELAPSKRRRPAPASTRWPLTRQLSRPLADATATCQPRLHRYQETASRTPRHPASG